MLIGFELYSRWVPLRIDRTCNSFNRESQLRTHTQAQQSLAMYLYQSDQSV